MHLHEIGHNMYLHHSGIGDFEYGDVSSAMGYCCATRCYHFIHSWQLGWATFKHELQTLDITSRPTAFQLELPAVGLSAASGVKLTPSQPASYHYVLSYRGDAGLDDYLFRHMQHQVH